MSCSCNPSMLIHSRFLLSSSAFTSWPALALRPSLTSVRKPSTSTRHFSQQHEDDLPVDVMNFRTKINWADRIGLQNTWSLKEKGWKVHVDWRMTPYGAGIFACEDIQKDTLLRVGVNGRNLIQFRSTQDIDDFCAGSKDLLNYVADYMWGFDSMTDEGGYEIVPRPTNAPPRFFGMWVPGNGLNHSVEPNTVYRPATGGTDQGINLVALRDISKNEELFDDYRRHGTCPKWLLDFASEHQLNFADCNTFVNPARD